MPLKPPILDDRRYDDIVREARSLIPRYLPEWTDHNLSDPGMTLVQLFAWMSDMLLYRINRVPELHFIRFLQLIGVDRKPTRPASAELTFTLTESAPPVVFIPRGSRVGASPLAPPPSALNPPGLPTPAEDEPLIFETQAPLVAIKAVLKHVRVYDGINFVDRTTASATPGQAFAPFGNRLRVHNALLLGFASRDFPHDEVSLLFRVWTDPGRTQELLCDGSAMGAPPATVAWEYLDRDGIWRPLEVLRDETRAFTATGRLYFRGPSGIVPMDATGVTGDPVFWFRARLVATQYERAPQLDAVVTNTVPALAVTSVVDEVLASSNGEPGQRFLLRNRPVHAAQPRSVDERLAEKRARTEAPTDAEQAQRDAALREREYARGFMLEVDEGRGFEPWEEVDDFLASGPFDRHYVLNRAAGEVLFGNRERGSIPLAGINNIVVRVYRHGGGARGNVGAGAIADLQTPIAGVDGVTNLWPAEGGADEEALEDTKDRAPRELKSRGRAVTGEDFELLALQTPGALIRRAHALPLYHPQFPDVEIPGVVTVLVLPESDLPRPMPSETTLQAVCRHLDQHRLLTTEVHVAPPRFAEVRIETRVVAAPSADPGQVKSGIEQALLDFLHPLKGGPEGRGWPLGQQVLFSDVFRVAFGIAGVESIEDLRIVIMGERKGRCENAPIARDQVVFSTGHDVSVAFAGTQ